MMTYTQPWDRDRVAECVAGHRSDPEAAERQRGRMFHEMGHHLQLGFFVTDIANAMTYTHGRDGERVAYQLTEGGLEVERLIAVALDRAPYGRRYGGPLDRVLHDWMREVWRDVVRHGRAIHEVAPLLPAREAGEFGAPETSGGFALLRLDPQTVRQRWGRWGGLVQRVSTVDQREHGLGARVPVEGERFAVFELPGALAESVREAVSGLRGEDVGSAGLSVAPWLRPDLYALGYTLDGHLRARDAVMARATRAAGYHARGQLDTRITNHYLVRRQIRAARFGEALRRAFLDHLNGVLDRQAERLGACVRVEAANTLTDDEFDAAEQALRAGTGTFREIMRRVRG